MMNTNAVRAARLVYIRDLLMEEPHTIRQLAHLCDVQERTICRDLVTLQIPPINLPLWSDDDGYWHILRASHRPRKTPGD